MHTNENASESNGQLIKHANGQDERHEWKEIDRMMNKWNKMGPNICFWKWEVLEAYGRIPMNKKTRDFIKGEKWG